MRRAFPYEKRLRLMDLPTLAYRRLRGNTIKTYKFLHGLYSRSVLLPLVEKTSSTVTVTRGHSLKLQNRECRSSVRQNFFSYTIVNFWNSLPESVVTAPTLNFFKNRFDKHCIARKFSSTLWKSTVKISQQAYGLYTTVEEADDDDDYRP